GKVEQQDMNDGADVTNPLQRIRQIDPVLPGIEKTLARDGDDLIRQRSRVQDDMDFICGRRVDAKAPGKVLFDPLTGDAENHGIEGGELRVGRQEIRNGRWSAVALVVDDELT